MLCKWVSYKSYFLQSTKSSWTLQLRLHPLPPQVIECPPNKLISVVLCVLPILLNQTHCFSPWAVLHSFLVSVQYLGQEMLRREVQDKDIRISYMPVAPVPPPPSSQTTFHRIPLPDPPISMASEPAMQAISTLLPFMEKGVMLTSTGSGVYAKRCCQGRVFWRGPHTPSSTSPNKMERTVERVMVFSRKAFIEGEGTLSWSQGAVCLLYSTLSTQYSTP